MGQASLNPINTIENNNLPTVLAPKSIPNETLSKDEVEFYFVYVMVIYKVLDIFESLLKTICSPQNFYHVHGDKKVIPAFKDPVGRLLSCFADGFLTSKRKL